MKKNILKGIFLVVVTITAIGVNMNSQDSKTEISLFAKNIEALANSTPEDSEFKCAMKKDDCYIENVTEYTLEILSKKYGGFGGFKVGDRVDISKLTQLFALAEYPWEDKIRCGKDITCNDLMSSLK